MVHLAAQIALLLIAIAAMLSGAVLTMVGAVEIVAPVIAPRRALALATTVAGLLLFVGASLRVAALAVPV